MVLFRLYRECACSSLSLVAGIASATARYKSASAVLYCSRSIGFGTWVRSLSLKGWPGCHATSAVGVEVSQIVPRSFARCFQLPFVLGLGLRTSIFNFQSHTGTWYRSRRTENGARQTTHDKKTIPTAARSGSMARQPRDTTIRHPRPRHKTRKNVPPSNHHQTCLKQAQQNKPRN